MQPDIAALVLVVDDDDAIRILHEETFKEAGFRVHPLPSAIDAIAWLAENRPDAAVIDLGMAGASGLQIIGTVREDERLADVPIVVVSGVAPDDEMWGAAEWGWDAYLQKPADLEELTGTVHDLIARTPTRRRKQSR